MPELPEVETIVRILRPVFVDKTIKEVKLFSPTIVNGDQKEFIKSLPGKKVIDLFRRGKYICFSC